MGLVNLPLMAAASKPLGMVVAADHAYLDHANAATGASVYSDDALVTEQGGSLRLSVGPSQIYLLSLSSASLEPRDDKIEARVDRGTVGFSTARPSELQIQTPLGVVRGADANPIFGQVSLLTPSKLRISSYKGTLVVEDINGGQKMIAQGETYEGTLVSDASARRQPTQKGQDRSGRQLVACPPGRDPSGGRGISCLLALSGEPITHGVLELVAE